MSPLLFWFRFDAKTRYLSLGLNIGNPSNPSKNVILSRSDPSNLIKYRSKSLSFSSCKLEEKIILFPSGKKYGPKFAALLFVLY